MTLLVAIRKHSGCLTVGVPVVRPQDRGISLRRPRWYATPAEAFESALGLLGYGHAPKGALKASAALSQALENVIPTVERLRQEAGLTRTQLCARAGVSPETYRRLRLGTQGPKIETILKLLGAL